MAWKDEQDKKLKSLATRVEAQDVNISSLHERLFYSELAIRALIKINTISQKFVSPKEYSQIVEQVYNEINDELKRQQAEALVQQAQAQQANEAGIPPKPE